jgi:type I restriction enzyme S subunit
MTSLPVGWQEFSLGELLKFSNGINADKSAYGRGIPFANVLEVINNESLGEDDIPGRISLPQKVLARYEVRRGDFLFNRTSETQEEVGLASVYLGDQPVVFGGFVLRGRPLTTAIDIGYAKYALRTAEVRNQIIARGQGGIRANVGQGDLKTVTITLPAIPEQRVIAEALDSASSQVAMLERLMAKKQAIRQGMMQQLLTGRTRLPGFTGKWVTKTWGELAPTISSGATPRRSHSDYWGGNIPWVTSTELKRGVIGEIPQKITQSGLNAANLTIWPASTFLMAITGLEAAGTRGSCGILDVPAATNQSCMAVVPGDQLDTSFLFFYYLLRGEELAFRFTQGTKQQSYTAGIIKTLPIRLPIDVAEQRAIAVALREATEEIHILEKRLVKAQDIKTGMMQQLLTGRTRLPVPETAA